MPSVLEAPEQMLSSGNVATVKLGVTVTLTADRGPTQVPMLLST